MGAIRHEIVALPQMPCVQVIAIQVLGKTVRDVDAEAIGPAIAPKRKRVAEELMHFGVVPIEVGLFGREHMEIPLPVSDARPRGTAELRRPIGGRKLAGLTATVPEDIAGALGRTFSRGKRRLEPGMLVGGMIRNDIDHDFDSRGMRGGDEGVKIFKRSQTRIDVTIIGNVVTAIDERRRIEGAHPNGVHSELGQIRHLGGDAVDIPQTRTRRVLKRTRIYLIDNGVRHPRTGLSNRLLAHGDQLLIQEVLVSKYYR